MRGADGGPWQRICALPALWVGLLYDEDALAAAEALTANWTAQDVFNLREGVPALGLKAKIKGHSLLDIGQEAVAIAHEGLSAGAG